MAVKPVRRELLSGIAQRGSESNQPCQVEREARAKERHAKQLEEYRRTQAAAGGRGGAGADGAASYGTPVI